MFKIFLIDDYNNIVLLSRTIKITIGGIPGGGSDIISNRLSLVSNLVKDSLIYAFQEALKPSVEQIVTGPALRNFLAKELPLH
jgi:hypothetical protein